MKPFSSRFSQHFATALIIAAAAFSPLSRAAEANPLAAALPDAATLTSTETCSEQQNHVMASLGLGKMACAISKHVSFESLGRAIGIPAFQPNSRNNPLNPSDNVDDFVRYNPAFFSRVNEYYLQEPDRSVYSFMYKHFLTDTTRLFYMTGYDLRVTRKIGNLNLAQYRKATQEPKAIYAEAFAQCRRNQAMIVKAFGSNYHYKETFTHCGKSTTASLFWYRRQLDGSGDALYQLLDNILKTQDKEFYTQFRSAVAPKKPA